MSSKVEELEELSSDSDSDSEYDSESELKLVSLLVVVVVGVVVESDDAISTSENNILECKVSV